MVNQGHRCRLATTSPGKTTPPTRPRSLTTSSKRRYGIKRLVICQDELAASRLAKQRPQASQHRQMSMPSRAGRRSGRLKRCIGRKSPEGDDGPPIYARIAIGTSRRMLPASWNPPRVLLASAHMWYEIAYMAESAAESAGRICNPGGWTVSQRPARTTAKPAALGTSHSHQATPAPMTTPPGQRRTSVCHAP